MAKLKGKGWTLRIWENLGWHCAAQNKTLSVSTYKYKQDRRTYSCLLASTSRTPGGGAGFWTERKRGPFYDPNDAVRYAIESARHFVDRVTAVVEAVEAIGA